MSSMAQVPRRRGRPPGPTLDRQQVLGAAAELARQDLARLTMSALAESLGVTSMALYRHYRSKEELFAALYDDILSGVEVPPGPSGDWEDRLRRLHRDVMQAMERCSGISDMIGSLPPGPHSARLLEGYLSILLDSGITRSEAVLAYTAIYYLAIGGVTHSAHRKIATRAPHATPAATVNTSYPSEVLTMLAPTAARIRSRDVQDYGIAAIIDSIKLRSFREEDPHRAAPPLPRTTHSPTQQTRHEGASSTS
jgi:AcrR family transcriptional regulator